MSDPAHHWHASRTYGDADSAYDINVFIVHLTPELARLAVSRIQRLQMLKATEEPTLFRSEYWESHGGWYSDLTDDRDFAEFALSDDGQPRRQRLDAVAFIDGPFRALSGQVRGTKRILLDHNARERPVASSPHVTQAAVCFEHDGHRPV